MLHRQLEPSKIGQHRELLDIIKSFELHLNGAVRSHFFSLLQQQLPSGDEWHISHQSWMRSNFSDSWSAGVDLPRSQRKHLDKKFRTFQPVPQLLHLFPTRFLRDCGPLFISDNLCNVGEHPVGYDLSTQSVQSQIRRLPRPSAKHHSPQFVISGSGGIRAVC